MNDGTSIGGVTLDDEVASTISANGNTSLPVNTSAVSSTPMFVSMNGNGNGNGLSMGVCPPSTPMSQASLLHSTSTPTTAIMTNMTNMNTIPSLPRIGSPAAMMAMPTISAMNGMPVMNGMPISTEILNTELMGENRLFPAGMARSGISSTASSVISHGGVSNVSAVNGKGKAKKGRLGNREYFQVVEAVNTLQEKMKGRRQDLSPVRLNSGAVMKVIKKVNDYQNGLMTVQSLHEEMEEIIPLAACANQDEFDSFCKSIQIVSNALRGKSN